MTITIYEKPSCSSSRVALIWLDNHNLEYEKLRMNSISFKHLVSILKMTECGLDDIVRTQRTPAVIKKKVKKLYSLTFSEALNYLLLYPELLRTPIIFSENKLLVGYNSEEIRKFIPKAYR
ncbi:ArsC/Spx/MgsR family protein [Lactococcus garvieae]|uniref:ArsC/Spx/MgsR family protein n=1 Tax=Lactococcus garvieae TaxID=1363 RepID=UPI0030D5F44A